MPMFVRLFSGPRMIRPETTGSTMQLDIRDIRIHYGKAIAVDGISIHVGAGEVVAVVGANGSGKSTILKAISGLTPVSSGEIWFGDERIDRLPPYEIVRRGVVQVPEGRRLFPYLSVWTNMQMGASLRKDKAGIRKDMEEVFEHFPILRERRNQKAGSLSGGEQQMLAIARALLGKPKLLCLDEPSLGLAPIMVNGLVPVIKNINKQGVGVLLVEQNVPLALKAAERAYALQVGKVILEGDVETFRCNDLVRKAYLGG